MWETHHYGVNTVVIDISSMFADHGAEIMFPFKSMSCTAMSRLFVNWLTNFIPNLSSFHTTY